MVLRAVDRQRTNVSVQHPAALTPRITYEVTRAVEGINHQVMARDKSSATSVANPCDYWLTGGQLVVDLGVDNVAVWPTHIVILQSLWQANKVSACRGRKSVVSPTRITPVVKHGWCHRGVTPLLVKHSQASEVAAILTNGRITARVIEAKGNVLPCRIELTEVRHVQVDTSVGFIQASLLIGDPTSSINLFGTDVEITGIVNLNTLVNTSDYRSSHTLLLAITAHHQRQQAQGQQQASQQVELALHNKTSNEETRTQGTSLRVSDKNLLCCKEQTLFLLPSQKIELAKKRFS